MSTVAKKKKADAPARENDLNIRREAFCQYFTKNQALFGNATLSYAEAYGYKLDELPRDDYKLDELPRDDAKYKGKGKKRVMVEGSSYDKAYHVCATEGGRLLKIPEIQERITALLNELLRDDIVDSQLAKVITQDYDLQSKVRAINEYNKVRGRIIDKSKVEIERFAMDDIRELLAPLPLERQDEIYAILTGAIAEAEALRGAAQVQEGHTQQP
jgi:hypothetical protein